MWTWRLGRQSTGTGVEGPLDGVEVLQGVVVTVVDVDVTVVDVKETIVQAWPREFRRP
jgi:hypothetical protein